MTHTSLTIVNHGSACFANVAFADESGVAAVPTNVYYSLLNLANNTLIVNHISAGTPAATMKITIKSSENEIATLPTTPRHAQEKRRFLIHAIFGADNELWDYLDYEVVGVEGQQ